MNNSSLWLVLYKMRLPFIVIILCYAISIIGLLLISGVDQDGQPYQMSIFDAFYFISYTATTIGFGESPYDFTYGQKLWVTVCIYITVIGWFYSIGTLISLLQNKLFLQEISRVNFRRSIKNINEKFIIILGYNQITIEIIKRAIQDGIRPVVIEIDENRANDLMLENFTPYVPVLVGDVRSTKVFEEAGIKKKNCKAVVSLFESENLNFRVSLITKLLNKNVTLAVKSTTKTHSENLEDLGVEIIINPFETIAQEIDMAINKPHILKLQKWVYNISHLGERMPHFPKGKYVVCGYGRMGYDIYEVLKQNNLETKFIEHSVKKAKNFDEIHNSKIVVANADDKEVLKEAGIENAKGVIAATNSDTTNLSILSTSQKLNPDILTIARENELEDYSIFSRAKIDHIFVPANILINKTTNSLINPIFESFIDELVHQDEQWGQKLVRVLHEKIGEDPILFELFIDKKEANEIVYQLSKGFNIPLKTLTVSLYNRELNNNVVPLLLIRGDEKILLPSLETNLLENDQLLFACDKNTQSDIEYITQNKYEFHYAFTGREKRTIFKG